MQYKIKFEYNKSYNTDFPSVLLVLLKGRLDKDGYTFVTLTRPSSMYDRVCKSLSSYDLYRSGS